MTALVNVLAVIGALAIIATGVFAVLVRYATRGTSEAVDDLEFLDAIWTSLDDEQRREIRAIALGARLPEATLERAIDDALAILEGAPFSRFRAIDRLRAVRP